MMMDRSARVGGCGSTHKEDNNSSCVIRSYPLLGKSKRILFEQ